MHFGAQNRGPNAAVLLCTEKPFHPYYSLHRFMRSALLVFDELSSTGFERTVVESGYITLIHFGETVGLLDRFLRFPSFIWSAIHK